MEMNQNNQQKNFSKKSKEISDDSILRRRLEKLRVGKNEFKKDDFGDFNKVNLKVDADKKYKSPNNISLISMPQKFSKNVYVRKKTIAKETDNRDYTTYIIIGLLIILICIVASLTD